jgi:ABC-type glycerol-3-phosphate transport system substrate-binding protein
MLKDKKIISIIIGITAILSMITLSACNTPTGNTNSTSQTSKAAAKGSVKMKVINFRVEDQKFYNEFNQSFMDKYPEVEVGYDAVPTASYVSLVSARMAANEVDVLGVMFGMELNQEYANFMVDLKGQAGLNGIGADYLKYTSKQGVQVSAPLNIIGIVAYYNKKIFADNNLQVPKTWTEKNLKAPNSTR